MTAEREMTLAEWVGRLPEFHLAHRQYTEMRDNTDKLAAEIVRLRGEVDSLRGQIHDEIAANLAFREAGGALPGEDMPTFCARLLAERDATIAPAEAKGDSLACYDAGLLSDYGGGNVEWWQDYIRAELGRAHDFYASQITPQPAGGEAVARDREADRARFADAAFNNWLDEGISDSGHTVWDAVGDVSTAWSAWCAREFYGMPPVADCVAPEEIYIRDGAGRYVLCDLQETTFDDLPLYCARTREVAPQPAGGECSRQCMDTMSCDNSCKPAGGEAVAWVCSPAENIAQHVGINSEERQKLIDAGFDVSHYRPLVYGDTTPPAAQVQQTDERGRPMTYWGGIPAPVQAAPQEGEAVDLEQFREAVMVYRSHLRRTWKYSGSQGHDQATHGDRLLEIIDKATAHSSACELGAVRELPAKWRAIYDLHEDSAGRDCADELEAALQHRGDSRGGEG